jgi:hypothetical protein
MIGKANFGEGLAGQHELWLLCKQLIWSKTAILEN